MAIPPRPATTGSSSVFAAVPTPRSAAPAPGLPTVAEPAAGAGPVGEPEVGRDDVAGMAWIVREVTHVPGVLRLRGGHLSFESTRGVLFDGTPAELELDPGRSSRAGLRVTVGGERLRVCVVRPAGGVTPCRELVERAAGRHPATSGELDAWTFWRPLLTPATSPDRARARVRRALALCRPEGRPSRACPS